MQKAKLPKNVADALEHLKHNCGSEGILSGVLGNANSRPFEILKQEFMNQDGGFTELLSALVNGYEIEETPEEKVSGFFNNPGPFRNGIGETSTAYRDGIVDTLDALGIKIKGVNDHAKG